MFKNKQQYDNSKMLFWQCNFILSIIFSDGIIILNKPWGQPKLFQRENQGEQ